MTKLTMNETFLMALSATHFKHSPIVEHGGHFASLVPHQRHDYDWEDVDDK